MLIDRFSVNFTNILEVPHPFWSSLYSMSVFTCSPSRGPSRVVQTFFLLKNSNFESRIQIQSSKETFWETFSQFKHYLEVAHLSWNWIYNIGAFTQSGGPYMMVQQFNFFKVTLLKAEYRLNQQQQNMEFFCQFKQYLQVAHLSWSLA